MGGFGEALVEFWFNGCLLSGLIVDAQGPWLAVAVGFSLLCPPFHLSLLLFSQALNRALYKDVLTRFGIRNVGGVSHTPLLALAYWLAAAIL